MGSPPHLMLRPRVDDRAAASLVLGLVSMTGIGPVAGVPAMILGALAQRHIDASGGSLTGRGLARAGIVSGLFGTGMGIVLALCVAGVALPSVPAQPGGSVASVGSVEPAATSTVKAPRLNHRRSER